MKGVLGVSKPDFVRPAQTRAAPAAQTPRASARSWPRQTARRTPLKVAPGVPTPLILSSYAAETSPSRHVQAATPPVVPSTALPPTFSSSNVASRAVATNVAARINAETDNAAALPISKPLTALVIGSGMAGLSAAAALSEQFDRVMLLEADEPKETWSQSVVEANKVNAHTRPGVGQYHLLHVLMARGALELDKLVPGYTKALIDAGGVQTEFLTQSHYVTPQGPFVPVPNSQQPLMIVQASRHLMEHTLRGLVTQNPRIQTTYGSHVKGLSFSNSGGSSKNSRVVGVKLADGQVVPADLAVIANGRRSDISAWLKAEGWPKAPVSTTSTNIRYVNWLTKLDPAVEAQLPYHGSYLQLQPPNYESTAVLQRIEGDIWTAVVGKCYNQGPKPDVADVLQFLQEDPYFSETFDILKGSQPLSIPVSFGRLGNTWHHFEKVLPPEGLLILGDAYCNFNPIYAQGMTVAAIEANILKSILSQRLSTSLPAAAAAGSPSNSSNGSIRPSLDLSGLAGEFYPAASAVVEASWLFAALRDMMFPLSTSENQTVTWTQRLQMAYVDVICKLATVDAEAAETFCRAMHMLDPPSAMFKPSIMAKALAHKLLRWPWVSSKPNDSVITTITSDKTLITQLAGNEDTPQPIERSQPQV